MDDARASEVKLTCPGPGADAVFRALAPRLSAAGFWWPQLALPEPGEAISFQILDEAGVIHLAGEGVVVPFRAALDPPRAVRFVALSEEMGARVMAALSAHGPGADAPAPLSGPLQAARPPHQDLRVRVVPVPAAWPRDEAVTAAGACSAPEAASHAAGAEASAPEVAPVDPPLPSFPRSEAEAASSTEGGAAEVVAPKATDASPARSNAADGGAIAVPADAGGESVQAASAAAVSPAVQTTEGGAEEAAPPEAAESPAPGSAADDVGAVSTAAVASHDDAASADPGAGADATAVETPASSSAGDVTSDEVPSDAGHDSETVASGPNGAEASAVGSVTTWVALHLLPGAMRMALRGDLESADMRGGQTADLGIASDAAALPVESLWAVLAAAPADAADPRVAEFVRQRAQAMLGLRDFGASELRIVVPWSTDMAARRALARGAEAAGFARVVLQAEPEAIAEAFDLVAAPVDVATTFWMDAFSLRVALIRRGANGFAAFAAGEWGDLGTRALDDAILAQLSTQAGWSEEQARPLLESIGWGRARVRPGQPIEFRLGPDGPTQSLGADMLRELAAPIVAEIVERWTGLLREGGVHPKTLGAVLLAGDAGHVPALPTRLAEVTGRAPSWAEAPRQAILSGALGLAVAPRTLETGDLSVAPPMGTPAPSTEAAPGRSKGLFGKLFGRG